MTKAQHTPAPWAVTGSTLLHVTGAPANIHIATITECRPSDAHLIAAAPNLLEALREIGQALERGDPQDIADKWFSLGVPAIAKAEGK